MELCRKLPEKKSDLNSDFIFGVAPDKLTNFGENFLHDIDKFIKIHQNLMKLMQEVLSEFGREVNKLNKKC